MRGLPELLAEQLGLRVGRGFIPGTKVMKLLWALAPEVGLSMLSVRRIDCARKFLKNVPQGLKAL
jgi:hypothetical protein